MYDKSNLAGLVSGLILAMAVLRRAEDRGDLPLAEGPFKPTLQSLEQYRCPEWFRDAKFGIWAHWGPQAVPMDGDWYAREIYEEGSQHYQYHAEALRPSVEVRLQGHYPLVEGGEVGPRPADGALQEGRAPAIS